jgi:hypothetical protein
MNFPPHFTQGDAEILICDPTGDSTPATIYSIIALIRYNTRVKDSVVTCRAQRPSIELSHSFKLGLSAMQKTVDHKVFIAFVGCFLSFAFLVLLALF